MIMIARDGRIVDPHSEEAYSFNDYAGVTLTLETAEKLYKALGMQLQKTKKETAFERINRSDHEEIEVGDVVFVRLPDYHLWLHSWSSERLDTNIWEDFRVTALVWANEVRGASLLRDGASNGYSYIPLTFLIKRN